MLRVLALAALVWSAAAPAVALDVPPLIGRIVDNAHLLAPDAIASLTEALAAHEARTGNQVAVLTLPSLEGEPLEEFSHRVATTWKLGRKGTDNGVLILVAPNDRKVRIEVGYGLEGTLTDVKSSRIIREEMAPRFRAGDFPGGISAGVKAVLGTIEGTYAAPEPKSGGGDSGKAVYFFAIGIGLIIGMIFGRWSGTFSGAAITFILVVAGGVLLAIVAAAITFALAGLFGGTASRARRSYGRESGWSSGGWSGGGDFSGGFSGGGGDFGGGGASGDW